MDVGAGVVDADYRGPVGVVLFNFGKEDFQVNIGDRVAQLILEQVSMVNAKEVEELDVTERGEGGFGSTGLSVSTSDGSPAKKLRAISPANSNDGIELNKVEDLLSLMLDIEEICQAPKEFRSSIKRLVLSGDSGVAAAFAVYLVKNNKNDLMETLELIASR